MPPLMHGSTSPSKNGFPPRSAGRSSQNPSSFQDRSASRRVTADSTTGSARSIPVARRRSRVERGDSQTGLSARRQEPSGSCRTRISAPIPSCGIRARSVAIAAGKVSVKSRIVCQLIAGSESRSQLTVSTAVILPLRRKISRKGNREWTRIETANEREWIRLRKATRLSSPKSYGATGSEQQTNPPSPSLRRDRPQMDADEELGIAAKRHKKRKKRRPRKISRKDKPRMNANGSAYAKRLD